MDTIKEIMRNMKKNQIEKAIETIKNLIENEKIQNISLLNYISYISSPCIIYEITKKISYNFLHDTDYSNINIALILLMQIVEDEGSKLFDIYKKLPPYSKRIRDREEIIKEIVKNLERLLLLKSIRNREKLSSMGDELHLYKEIKEALARKPISITKIKNTDSNLMLSAGGIFHCDHNLDIPSVFIKDGIQVLPVKQVRFEDIVQISIQANELKKNFLPISYFPRFLALLKTLFLLTATGKINIKSDGSFTVSTKELMVKKMFLLDMEKETKELFKWAYIDVFSLIKYILSPYTYHYLKEKMLLLINYGDRFLHTNYVEFRDRVSTLIGRFLKIEPKQNYIDFTLLKEYNLSNLQFIDSVAKNLE